MTPAELTFVPAHSVLPVERKPPTRRASGRVGTWALLPGPGSPRVLSAAQLSVVPCPSTPASNPTTRSHGAKFPSRWCPCCSLLRMRTLVLAARQGSDLLPSKHSEITLSPSPAPRESGGPGVVTLGSWKQPVYVWRLPLERSACPARVPAVGTRPARTHPWGHKAPCAEMPVAALLATAERGQPRMLPARAVGGSGPGHAPDAQCPRAASSGGGGGGPEDPRPAPWRGFRCRLSVCLQHETEVLPGVESVESHFLKLWVLGTEARPGTLQGPATPCDLGSNSLHLPSRLREEEVVTHATAVSKIARNLVCVIK